MTACEAVTTWPDVAMVLVTFGLPVLGVIGLLVWLAVKG